MEGRIYIASAFTNLVPANGPVDNDPHFWSNPPTWGICRPDFRANLDKNDYVFFVSSQNNQNFPQMIFAYMRIKKIIPHNKAFTEFPHKRMRSNTVINGNIIVDSRGNYASGDNGAHEDRFDQIKRHYAVGFIRHSRMLTPLEINAKHRQFLSVLNIIFDSNESSVYDILGQSGRTLNYQQIQDLLNWLNHGIIP